MTAAGGIEKYASEPTGNGFAASFAISARSVAAAPSGRNVKTQESTSSEHLPRGRAKRFRVSFAKRYVMRANTHVRDPPFTYGFAGKVRVPVRHEYITIPRHLGGNHVFATGNQRALHGTGMLKRSRVLVTGSLFPPPSTQTRSLMR